MVETNLFFKKLLAKRKELSTLETQVLEYMLKYPDKVSELNIDEFANTIYVSTATVSRTCKKLGFKGYQQLKYALDQYKGAKEEPRHEEKLIGEIAGHVNRFKKEMKQTVSALNTASVLKAVDLIKASQLVEFFGVGASFPCCSEAARKLTFAGKISSARNDWDELRAVASNLRPSDIAIIISHSGETLHLIEYATILNQRHVPLIVLTGTQGSQLEKFADLTLTAYSENHYYDEIDMSSRFTIDLLMDLVVIEYIKQRTY